MQLAADAVLRRSFKREPVAALARFELGREEQAALCAIPLEQLESHARSLIAKRWTELARVVDGVLSPGAAEGLRALAPLHAGLVADERAAPYAADLFAFEVLRAASREDGTPRELRSRFAPASIAEDAQRRPLAHRPRARAHSSALRARARALAAGMSFVGAGIGYRRAHRAALLAGEGPPVLEIMPDHFFAEPEALAALAQRYRLVFHDVGLSLGTVDDAATTRARLVRIKPLVRAGSPLLFAS